MKTFTYPQIAVSISGVATAANQATEIASLASIDAKTPALGQQLAAASQPVVLTAAQLSTLTPLTSIGVNNFPASQAVTGTFFQTTQPVSIATMPTTPVTGTFFQTTQPVSAAALPLPSGAATSALQTSGNSSLTSLDAKTPALGQALAAASVPVVLTAAQMTTLTPLAAVTANAGTNLNTSLLALDSTVAKDSSLSTLNTSVNTLLKPASTLAAVTTVGTVSAVTSITNALPAGTNIIGFVKAGGKTSANAPVRNDYSSTSVTTAAFVQLVASTTSAATEIEIFDSSGQTLALAFGAAASEVIQINIFPGGNGRIPLAVPAGTRVSIKAVSATASVGELNVNLYA